MDSSITPAQLLRVATNNSLSAIDNSLPATDNPLFTINNSLFAMDSSIVPAAPTSFSRFPELPIELRLVIWKLCLPPRVVNIEMSLKHQKVSRVWSNCVIGDDNFFDLAVTNALLYKNYEPLKGDGPAALPSITYFGIPLTSIMNTCKESRKVMENEGYIHTFGIFGSRARTLFCPWKDTLYIPHGSDIDFVLFDSGAEDTWELDAVEKLAIGMTYFDPTRSGDRSELWLAEVLAWVAKSLNNLRSLTLVMEYGLGVDYSNLSFMDVADFSMNDSITSQSDDQGNNQDTSDQRSGGNSDTLFETEKMMLTQWLETELDLADLAEPKYLEKLESLDRYQRVATTPKIQDTFRNAEEWNTAKNSRITVEVLHMETCYKPDRDYRSTLVCIDDEATITDLCSAWALDCAVEYTWCGRENFKICRNGVDLDGSTRVLDIDNIRTNSKLGIKVWDGGRWR